LLFRVIPFFDTNILIISIYEILFYERSTRYISVFILMSIYTSIFSQTVPYVPIDIYTPIGNEPVPDTWEFTGTDYSYSLFERIALSKKLKDDYGGAELLEVPTKKYNCHSYAWHVSEGGNKVWIGLSTSTAEDIYWTDESYIEVSSESLATKVSYENGNHSAITTNTSGWFKSKWGDGPLVYHKWDNVPDIYTPSDLVLRYYKLCFEKLENETISSDYSKDGCRFLLKNVTVQNNAAINITVDDWFKIEGTFNTSLGTTLSITP
ncbi:MAG: hypothetical protein JXB49_06595, partial [Bacteroidales bacterium]|nr:hypothetical protein [Bacteroidales bacterium]MBN2669911.1 hypothetical protein [Bacteroidales bacterium]